MRQPTHDNILRLWGASLTFIIVGIAVGLIVYGAADKRTVIRRASEQTLLDATFAAVSLDAVLRKALLEMRAASTREAFEGEAMARVAFGINEADNVYLLDERASVLATAYVRREASIDGAEEAFERLDAGAGSDYRIVDAPAEGGKALALISIVPSREDKRRYAVILFTGSSIFGELTAIGSGLYESMELRDQGGGTLSIIEANSARSFKMDPMLHADVPLASVPLIISTSSDRDLILLAWRWRAITLGVLFVIFGILLGSMFAYGRLLWKRANSAARLQKELEHQDLLFREVNHRIKNNLAIIITVLSLGAEKAVEHPDSAVTTLASAIDRIRAITLLHELLYREPKASRDDFGAYIESLASALSETYGKEGLLSIEATHDADIHFNLDKTVPLALMVNEIVTNAYKHAFPNGRKGTIMLRAAKSPDGEIAIQVSDDGIGMGEGKPESGGIGTLLIEALADQLHAAITRQENQPSGTIWTIRIPPEPESDSESS